MLVYCDTGILVPLYVNEVFSHTVTAFVAARREPIALNAFQQLELENALLLKVFRGDIDDLHRQAVLRKVQSHLAGGLLAPRPVNWIEALETARTLGAQTTATVGCRTLDLLHVAIALQWGCPVFASADGRQIEAARMAGIPTVIDICALHQSCGD